LFSGRSELLGPDQPHSVYFMDKFMQPTHLYLHSNQLDYPHQPTGPQGWEQTVVTYEAFRVPKFAPQFIQKKYNEGQFQYALARKDFNGTEEEYELALPGQFMDKWVSESSTKNLVRLIDEINTPGSALPQYLAISFDEYVWHHLNVKADALYQICVDTYISKYYDKVDDFFLWDRSKRKEHVDYVFRKDLWKLKPEHEHRMITKGYQESATKSMGKYFDIERSFFGHPGPLTKLNN